MFDRILNVFYLLLRQCFRSYVSTFLQVVQFIRENYICSVYNLFVLFNKKYRRRIELKVEDDSPHWISDSVPVVIQDLEFVVFTVGTLNFGIRIASIVSTGN